MKYLNILGIISAIILLIGIVFSIVTTNIPIGKRTRLESNTFYPFVSGEVISIEQGGGFNKLACIKIDSTNLRKYRRENEKIVLRIEDSMALLAFNTYKINVTNSIQVGSKVIIGQDGRFTLLKLIIDKDTIGKIKENGYLDNQAYVLYSLPKSRYRIDQSCIPK